MGLRFRKSVKLAPGVRLNLSKRGVGFSLGARGASISVGSRGIYGNLGIPGTGLSYRAQLDGSVRSARPRQSNALGDGTIRLALQDDGRVEITDASGNALSRKYLSLVKAQHADLIQQWLEQQCEMWNKGIDDILNLHLLTPAPDKRSTYTRKPPSVSVPQEPLFEPLKILDKLFRSRREKVEQRNAEREAAYQKALQQWQAEKVHHERAEDERQRRFERAQNADPEAMQEVLERKLTEISWPRETLVSFQIGTDGSRVLMDVDLPEIEDMPTQQAAVSVSGFKLNIKARSDTQRRQEYLTHVHAVGFRLTGEVFAALPSVHHVVLSGYSQRPDKTTGRVKDEYLYSFCVTRQVWSEVNFANLPQLDLPACFERFDLRRNMTKTGVFKAIEPFS